MVFTYVCRDQAGTLVRGNIDANSRAEAVRQLITQQVTPIRIDEASQPRTRKLSAHQRAQWYQQLSDLLSGGVPLIRSLEILEAQSGTHYKSLLNDIREEVSQGASLSASMAQQASFPEIDVQILRAGEEGGFVDQALQRLAEFTEERVEMQKRVTSALVYPAFLLATCVAVLIFLFVYLVPRFAPAFEQVASANGLPWPTVAVLALSDALREYWWLLIGGGFLAGFMSFRFSQSESGRHVFDRLALQFPWTGKLQQSLCVARFCRILGTLLANDVPVLQSMDISQKSIGNSAIEEAVQKARDSLQSGTSIAIPLKQNQFFPTNIVETIAVGEESNRLSEVLLSAAATMERQYQRQMEVALKLLEPVLLIVMGGIILFVVLALQLPLTELGATL